ncbi:hypothetical protein EB001_16425, partial [bacterium]|nr:hypothetical protein [bacterium]
MFQNNNQIGTASTNTFNITGLTAGTSYSYTVLAYDAVGNSSSQSQSLSVTTQQPAVVQPTPTPTPTPINNSQNGLILKYDFDEGSGSTIGDSSGNGYNASLSTGASSPVWVGGRVGQAVLLDGIDDFVQFSQLSAFSNLNSVTVSAWVYPKTVWSSQEPFIYNNTYGQSGFGLGGMWDGTATSRVLINGTTYDFQGISAPPVDQWTHIAFTYDSTTNKVYFFKNSIPSTAKIGPGVSIVSPTIPFAIGKSRSEYFKGFIDDVRIYNRALTPTEIASIYSGVATSNPGSSDTTAPSVPTNIASSNIANTSVTISWTPSTDNVGISGYKIYRNNVQMAVVTSGNSYTDSGLTAGSTYLYQVSAVDTSGNISNLSNPITITTTGQSATSFGTTQIPLPHVIQGRQGYSAQNIMWKDNAGTVHIINSFGGADVQGNEKAYLHYINTSTGASALVEGGMCSMGRNSIYDPIHNKFYWYGEYCSYQTGGSFNEFDPVTMTNIVIRNGGTTWYGGQSMALGEDGKIYFTAIHSGAPSHLYSYDPVVSVSSWKDLGIIYDISNANSPSLYVDKTHAYVEWGENTSNNYSRLVVRPLADGGTWYEVKYDDGLLVPANKVYISIDSATKKPYVYRDTGTGVKYYWLENGNAILITGTKPNSGYQNEIDLNYKHHISMMGYGNYNQFVSVFGYDMNWDNVLPNIANPVSTVHYGPHSTWNYPISGYKTSSLRYSGPWYDLSVMSIEPYQGVNKFFALGDVTTFYDYVKQVITTPIAGLPSTSIYTTLKVPASLTPSGTDEIYYAGYPNQVYRWIPTQTVSSRQAGTNPIRVITSEHMNYRYYLDYDSEGKIWIGGDMCGATAGCIDYGGVAWYDPKTVLSGEMFAGIWTGGNPPATGNAIKFTSLTTSNNRSKVVVSSNDGKLTVINALTKTIEGTYTLGVSAFMKEVSNDQVLGITTNTDPAGPRVFLFRPSDRTMIIAPKSIGVVGNIFGGSDGRFARMEFKPELGPDGYVWIYVDNKVYRVNPSTLSFQYVITDNTAARKLKWSNNGVDLISFGPNNVNYFPNILNLSSTQLSNIQSQTNPYIPTPSPTPVTPTSPTPTPVITDSDLDGISNTLDKCPYTPTGVTVNNYGCALPLTTKFTTSVNLSN